MVRCGAKSTDEAVGEVVSQILCPIRHDAKIRDDERRSFLMEKSFEMRGR